ncbi:hypothetical protein BpHYR1_020452 [Brachionus plicatilis]|uniref:Uncharacterized protein n=1 Tax=Brachionus plicatilis TaxID=10195 RepID=A0A3M7PZ17_BRAPC|nr:hypothetical protein BpHYR1_020452 [Brachionus plicatilis]
MDQLASTIEIQKNKICELKLDLFLINWLNESENNSINATCLHNNSKVVLNTIQKMRRSRYLSLEFREMKSYIKLETKHQTFYCFELSHNFAIQKSLIFLRFFLKIFELGILHRPRIVDFRLIFLEENEARKHESSLSYLPNTMACRKF